MAAANAYGPKSFPVLCWIVHSDLQRREIPDAATLLVSIMGVVGSVSLPGALLSDFAAALMVTIVLAAIGNALWDRTGRELLGLGDAKLVGAGTLVVGWYALWLMLLLSSVCGILAVRVGRVHQTDGGVPFGPFLAYGILATHLIAGPVS